MVDWQIARPATSRSVCSYRTVEGAVPGPLAPVRGWFFRRRCDAAGPLAFARTTIQPGPWLGASPTCPLETEAAKFRSSSSCHEQKRRCYVAPLGGHPDPLGVVVRRCRADDAGEVARMLPAEVRFQR